jgi:hypothetical protein
MFYFSFFFISLFERVIKRRIYRLLNQDTHPFWHKNTSGFSFRRLYTKKIWNQSLLLVSYFLVVLLLMKVKFDNFFVFFFDKKYFSLALQCYSHDTCSINCPQLSSSIKTCNSDENRCYKAAFPGGVTRGCAKDRCNIQVSPLIHLYQTKTIFIFLLIRLMLMQLWLMFAVKQNCAIQQ